MNHRQCEPFEELLVDYADGVLDGESKRQVDEHVAGCERCRRAVQALQRSLECAEVIWEDNAAQSSKQVAAPLGRNRRWRLLSCVAAAAVIVLGVSLSIYRRHVGQPVWPRPTAEQIERRIMDESSAATVLAATELLEGQTYATELVKSQYEYILSRYPDTGAAAKVKQRMR